MLVNIVKQFVVATCRSKFQLLHVIIAWPSIYCCYRNLTIFASSLEKKCALAVLKILSNQKVIHVHNVSFIQHRHHATSKFLTTYICFRFIITEKKENKMVTVVARVH
jgi:hypothetical protein